MKSPSNFERLVLGCIDSYDSDQRLILQHFWRSTRFAFLCTAQTSKIQEKIRPKYCWNEITPNFEGLVLGCIDSYDSNQILIFSGFSRSTRFSHFCTAQISKFQRKTVQFFAGMKMKFHFPFSFFDEFRDFSAKI